MKRIVFIVAVFMAFANISCKKEIYGCTDQAAENYSTYANTDDGSCFYPSKEVLISNTIENVDWIQGSNYYYVTLTWAEITSDVINNGSVSVYMGNDGTWVELPATFYQTSSYSSYVTAIYSVGEVFIDWSDSDGLLPDDPGTNDFKIVIFK